MFHPYNLNFQLFAFSRFPIYIFPKNDDELTFLSTGGGGGGEEYFHIYPLTSRLAEQSGLTWINVGEFAKVGQKDKMMGKIFFSAFVSTVSFVCCSFTDFN
jgi:hypothetical protein